MQETLYFTIFSWMVNLNKNNQHKLIISVYITIFTKTLLSDFGVAEHTTLFPKEFYQNRL